MEYQSFKVWKIEPSTADLNEDIDPYKRIHGEVVNNCILEIKDHAAILTGEDGYVKAIFSLHHFYIKNYTGY